MKYTLALIVALAGMVASASTTFYDNQFWFDEHGVPLKKSAVNFWTHLNWDNNVIVSGESPSAINEVLTWDTSYLWTATAYDGMISYLTLNGSNVENLIPYPVSSGGIGTGGTYFSSDGTTIGLFVEDE